MRVPASLLLVLTLAAVLLPPSAAARDSFARWTQADDAIDEVRIRVKIGSLTVVPSDGNQIEVSARLRGRKSDREAIRFEVKERGGVFSVAAAYPPMSPMTPPPSVMMVVSRVARSSTSQSMRKRAPGSAWTLAPTDPRSCLTC